MINSVAIYCIYSEDGCVEEYVKYSIQMMREVVDQIIIVSNGNIRICDIEELKQFVDNVIVRDNKGYDAGAYKYVLDKYLSDEEIANLDQLVLVNDSFYGPFVPWKYIFEHMREKKVDYWGINYRKNVLLEFVQSYMMVFNKPVLKSGDLKEFFSRYIYDNDDWNGTCARFEIGLSQFLNCKYTYATYVDAPELSLYCNAYDGVSTYGLPLIKKKCCSQRFLGEDVFAAIQWVHINTDYNVNFILKSLYKKNVWNKPYEEFRNMVLESQWLKNEKCTIDSPKINLNQIEKFIESNKKFYIYGTGWWGKVLYVILQKDHKNFGGFIVTKKNDINQLYGKPVYQIDECMDFEGIIIGMSKDNTNTLGIDLECGKTLSLWQE